MNTRLPAQISTIGAPKITLGIPTRNRVEPLYALLDSLRRQTYRNFEILVSDDGHSPTLATQLQATFPDLPLRVVSGPGRSLPTNRQHILDTATTPLVVMCDDDHIMDERCVEFLVETALRYPKAGIVSAIWPHPHENPKTITYSDVARHPDFKLTLEDVDVGGDLWWKNGCETFKAYHVPPEVFHSEFAGGGCLLYRRGIIESVGGFPVDYSTVSFREDTDMSHRVFLGGYEVLVDPRAIALHLCAPTGGCKDTDDWATNFTHDGLLFLNKLSAWRKERGWISASVLERGEPTLHCLNGSNINDGDLSSLPYARTHLRELLHAEFILHELSPAASFSPSPLSVPSAAQRLILAVSAEHNFTEAATALLSGEALGVVVTDTAIMRRCRGMEGVLFVPGGELYDPELSSHALRNALLKFRMLAAGVSFPIKEPSNEEIRHGVENRIKPFFARQSYDTLIVERQGRYATLHPGILQSEHLKATLASLPPFYFHFGGIGDALLLLSTFYDQAPHQVILSVPHSIESMVSLFEAFPKLSQVIFIPVSQVDAGFPFLRELILTLPHCRGGGVTPRHSHVREWTPGVPLLERYGIDPSPRWAKEVRARRLRSPQIVLAPSGSGRAMPDGRRNDLPDEIWFSLLNFLHTKGVVPSIIGTPGERERYPAPPFCEDARSIDLSFHMELIAGADLLISADSWSKTFAALRGIPTIVHGPYNANGPLRDDPSNNIFLTPWPTLFPVYSWEELLVAWQRIEPMIVSRQYREMNPEVGQR